MTAVYSDLLFGDPSLYPVAVAQQRRPPTLAHPPTRRASCVQMGLGVIAVVGSGVLIPYTAVQLQFWKAKG